MAEPWKVTRLVRVSDAESLAELITADRDFQAPWEPVRAETYLTAAGQRAGITDLLAQHQAGRTVPLLITDTDGSAVGRITLSSIERGAFMSGRVGYWVASWANGRGLATAAVTEVVQLAFGDLGLHRLEAGTLTDNPRSQRVLERVGFTRFGLAPSYLQIGGRWRDHVLFQLLATDEAARTALAAQQA